MAQVKRTAQGIDWKEALESDGDVLKTLVQQVIEQVLEAEMDEALGAGKSERVEGRLGYRSGYRSRTLITRVGKLELRVPQDREGRFSTQLFERYQRSEKALVSALAEMYVQGVSTRKVKAIAVCVSSAGGGLPVPDPRRPLREGAGLWLRAQPCSDGGDRDQLGRSTVRAGCGAGQPGERDELARVSGEAGGAGSARRGVGDQ